jgi:hypothetical protein
VDSVKACAGSCVPAIFDLADSCFGFGVPPERIYSASAFEQQVMICVSHRPAAVSGHLIGVETPSLTLVFLDCFADVLVMPDFHTFVFVRQDFTPMSPLKIANMTVWCDLGLIQRLDTGLNIC